MFTKVTVQLFNDVSQTIILYILNLYSDIYQLYLNKTGRKNIEPEKKKTTWIIGILILTCYNEEVSNN